MDVQICRAFQNWGTDRYHCRKLTQLITILHMLLRIRPKISLLPVQRFLSGGESFEVFYEKASLSESSLRISQKSESQCVIVFGSAGMTPKQLSKFSQLYNNLGFKTISCILPQEHIFHYDIPQIKACSQKVLDL